MINCQCLRVLKSCWVLNLVCLLFALNFIVLKILLLLDFNYTKFIITTEVINYERNMSGNVVSTKVWIIAKKEVLDYVS